MYLPTDVVILLSSITVGAGIISVLSHMMVTHPLLKGFQQLTEKSKRISEGQFDTKLEEKGPKEIKDVAAHFNHMGDNLDEMFRKVKQSEAFKQELIANISHDLKTPIASIQSYVEALQDGIIEDEQTREVYLQTIQNETNRLSLLIRELLDLSQLEQNQMNVAMEVVHIDQLILETLQEFEIIIREKDITMDVDIPEHPLVLYGIPNQLKRVLSNLVDNAIRYTGEKGRIQLQAEQEGTRTIFRVADNGPGISEKHHQDIFERFYRVEKSRNKQYGGSGLGLAISKEIIEHHGGEINVESAIGKGTTFWFTIPHEKKEEHT